MRDYESPTWRRKEKIAFKNKIRPMVLGERQLWRVTLGFEGNTVNFQDIPFRAKICPVRFEDEWWL